MKTNSGILEFQAQIKLGMVTVHLLRKSYKELFISGKVKLNCHFHMLILKKNPPLSLRKNFSLKAKINLLVKENKMQFH